MGRDPLGGRETSVGGSPKGEKMVKGTLVKKTIKTISIILLRKTLTLKILLLKIFLNAKAELVFY